jgi:hypothetical protein
MPTTLFGASWKTTLAGFFVATALYAQEALTAGTVLPKDTHGWMMFVISAGIAIWGRMQKDMNVSNAPKPAIAAVVEVPAGVVEPTVTPTREATP